jgi:hypothetical protein
LLDYKDIKNSFFTKSTLVGKSGRKKTPCRLRLIEEENIKRNLKNNV